MLSLVTALPLAMAQEGAPAACPSLRVMSKNLSLVDQQVTTCTPCASGAVKFNRSDFTIRIKLTPATPCDETASVIPAGSILKVEIHRYVRIDAGGSCPNVERGSFFNRGAWTLTDPAGNTLFQGDIFRGTVGLNSQAANRCCNRVHEEAYIEGKGTTSVTTGWHFRAMAVIQSYFNLTTCKYSPNWTGKLDGVISQE
jgi:hypothetical protein